MPVLQRVTTALAVVVVVVAVVVAAALAVDADGDSSASSSASAPSPSSSTTTSTSCRSLAESFYRAFNAHSVDDARRVLARAAHLRFAHSKLYTFEGVWRAQYIDTVLSRMRESIGFAEWRFGEHASDAHDGVEWPVDDALDAAVVVRLRTAFVDAPGVRCLHVWKCANLPDEGGVRLASLRSSIIDEPQLRATVVPPARRAAEAFMAALAFGDEVAAYDTLAPGARSDGGAELALLPAALGAHAPQHGVFDVGERAAFARWWRDAREHMRVNAWMPRQYYVDAARVAGFSQVWNVSWPHGVGEPLVAPVWSRFRVDDSNRLAEVRLWFEDALSVDELATPPPVAA